MKPCLLKEFFEQYEQMEGLSSTLLEAKFPVYLFFVASSIFFSMFPEWRALSQTSIES